MFQRLPRRRFSSRLGLQVLLRGLVIVSGERDPGQQQAAPSRGQPARQVGRGVQVAEREADQRLALGGSRQQFPVRFG
jgi:hypothetical protein